jgi:hypothetical protein
MFRRRFKTTKIVMEKNLNMKELKIPEGFLSLKLGTNANPVRALKTKEMKMNKDRIALIVIVGILVMGVVGAIGMELADKFFVKENGYVGIGIDNPVSILHVLQGTGPRITLGNSQDTSYIQAMPVAEGSNLEFGTSRSTKMVIAPNGKVGIGIDNPVSILHVLQGTGPRISLGNYQDTSYIQAMPVAEGSNLEFGTSRSTKMVIAPNGSVGIGNTNPQEKLDVNGNIRATGTIQPSDARLKDIIKPYNRGLSEVMQIQPIYYKYKQQNALGLDSTDVHVGVTAQSVQGIIPEAVSKSGDGYLTLDKDPIVWALVNGMQEQQKEIEQLRQELNQKCK